MLRSTPIAVCLLVVAAFLAGAWTQDAGAGAGASEKEAPKGFDMAAMAEAMRLAQPGPEHGELTKRAGEWETEVAVSMMPGAPPMKQTGTASSRMILGGRFMEVESKGTVMGQPFETRSLFGFDRRHEEYIIIQADTMGTYWVAGRGVRDEDGVIRMHGEDDDPMGKQVYTFEYEILGPDEHEYRVVFHQLGPQVFEEPFTMVTVRSKRKPE